MVRHVFLSPHPDDVVWSCGGWIARLIAEGFPVLVITIFDGDSDGRPVPAAESWREIARPALRRAEDIAALKILGTKRLSTGFVDAALRHVDGNWLYRTPEMLFEDFAPADRFLVQSIRKKVLALLTPGDQLNIPLARSAHIDHRLVRQAAECASPNPLFYAEFPYEKQPLMRNVFAHAKDTDFTRWLTAALRYRSQVQAFFGNPGAFRDALKDWAHAVRPSDPVYTEHVLPFKASR